LDAGLSEPSRVKRIEVVSDWHDTCRHFAGMTHDSETLIVAPEFAGDNVPPETIVAILAHEAGHAVDLARPGELFFRQPHRLVCPKGGRWKVMPMLQGPRADGKCLIAMDRSSITSKVKNAWYGRGKDEVEQVADAVAETVLRRRIGYAGPCLIQTLDKGIVRPEGLR
jgi:hypothetical protein